MIRALRISNFALIDSLSLDFSSGFTVITGETGSGKSILLNALNLILGERANFSVIGPRGDKSTVETDLDISGFDMKDFFSKNELDYDDLTIVRREISTQGRSRAFINDTPVQLNVLKEFSAQLIQIHSQYNTLELKDRAYQLYVLDVLAGLTKERKEFQEKWSMFRKVEQQLEGLRASLSQEIAQEDYNAFQFQELEALRLDAVNYDALEEEARRGENSDEIRAVLAELDGLFSDELGIVAGLNRAKALLARRKGLDVQFEAMYERLNGLYLEAEDIQAELNKLGEKIEFDPERLAELTHLLDAYHRASQKHSTSTQQELIDLRDSLGVSAKNLEELRQQIIELEKERDIAQEALNARAEELHKCRSNAVGPLAKELQDSLHALKLENTTLEFRLERLDSIQGTGCTALEIYFSPNSGIAAVPVHEAASGGELSRVMLSLQSLMSTRIQLRTVLFDEIDTGVSGDVAQKMGHMLQTMGKAMQVIAITHLPQVAAKGGQHIKVSKSLVGSTTTSEVRELSMEERIEETARLMSGDTISSAALETAKALMN